MEIELNFDHISFKNDSAKYANNSRRARKSIFDVFNNFLKLARLLTLGEMLNYA